MSLSDLKFKPGTYLAFVLSDESRSKLLGLKPPAFGKVICHHVTIKFKPTEAELNSIQKLFDKNDEVLVTGYSKGAHIECFTVTIGGKAYDGNRAYHITHSLEAPAKPVDSNALLSKNRGIPDEKFKTPIRASGKFELISL